MLLAHAIPALRARAGRTLDRHGDLIAPAAIGLIALAARFYALGDKPFWLDEILTVRRANQDLATVIADSLHNHHLPTYFLLISAILPFGLGEAIVRLPSVLFGAFSAGLVCSIAGRFGGRAAGLVGGLLMALSPYQVQMGQEARSYAMVTCLILLGMWGAIRVVDAASQPARERPPARAGWIAYVVGTAGALLVLPVAIPWFVAANIAVLAFALKRSPERAAFMRRWIVVQLGIAAVAAPGLIAIAVVNHGNFMHAFDWIPPKVPTILRRSLAATYLMRISDVASFELLPIGVPGMGLAGAALCLAGLWSMRRSPQTLALLGVALLALPVTLIAVSTLKSVAIPRYFAWGAGPFFVLAGLGIAALPLRLRSFGCAAMLALATINLLPYYDAETKPRWDLAASHVNASLQSDDVILAADPWIPYMFGAFAERLPSSQAVTVTQSVDEAASSLAAGHRVWAVYGRVGQGRMESFDTFRERIGVLGQATLQWDEGRHIHVLRFDPVT